MVAFIMKRRKRKKKKPLSFRLSKKYKTLNQNQITEIIENTKNLFTKFESIEEISEQYKILQSAVSLIIHVNEPTNE
jgi:hypothetical protein